MDIMNYSSDFDIKENFLEKEDFKRLKFAICESKFPWYYANNVADETDNDLGSYYYQHNMGTENAFYDFMLPVYAKLNIELANNTIQRTRVNHYPRTEKILEHGLHRDQDYHLKTMLLFVNTCDGYTYLKEPDRRVYSVENTAIFFDSWFLHRSTTTTNANRRITLQVNHAPF